MRELSYPCNGCESLLVVVWLGIVVLCSNQSLLRPLYLGQRFLWLPDQVLLILTRAG